jgi:hypothetical protein
MALYEIKIRINPSTSVTLYKDKNNIKAAYDFAIEQGIEIFGRAPDGVSVTEPKPA